MTADLERIYSESPQEPPLSRLEPYKELILRWRRDGRSFPSICKLLQIQCGVEITREPLRQYVGRRTRKVKRAPVPVEPRYTPSVTTDHGTLDQQSPKRRSPIEKAALRDAALAANRKPTVARKEQQEFFVFDEDKPLTLVK